MKGPSSLEAHIIKVLKKEKILFKREKKFSMLRGGKLRYDFYIPDYRGQEVLIEVDGPHHFKFNPRFFKTQNDFKRSMGRDRYKNNYALVNKINLYRIPYYDVEKIKTFQDIINPIYRVRDNYHNDILKKKIEKEGK